jgi:phosphoribosyl-ATP pyrophosphohydrolase
MSKKYGYHVTKIEKGILGDVSKVEEELAEYKDAMKQGSEIMAVVELADVYGALEALCEKHNLTMKDLKKFSKITKRAFRNGHR